MIRVFTTIFPVVDPARATEFGEALQRNAACPALDQIGLLAESGANPPVDSRKIRVRPVPHRPTYADFFAWISEIAGPDDISIIANSDIYFEDSLGTISRLLQPDDCYALSRWDVREDGSSQLFDRNDSQDAWIFRGPIRENFVADFPLGVPRCDNRLLHELVEAGYRVRNPAFSLRAYHLHAGARSEYGGTGENFVDPPYRYLYPHNLLSAPRTLWHNLRHPAERVGWRFDGRRVENLLPIRAARRLAAKLPRPDRRSPNP